MSFFRKIKAGLVKSDIESFVGEEGNIFFNVETGELRLSDGVTPGGLSISGTGGAIVSETEPSNPDEGAIWYKESTNELSVFGGFWSTISGGDGGGPRGFTGSSGYTGSQGYIGSSGTVGYTGSAGTNGYTGSQGSIGFTGSSGTNGYTGSAGLVNGLTSNNVDTITVNAGYSIIPETDGLQNLGSPTNRFGTAYVGTNSIDIGGTVLSADPDGRILIKTSNNEFSGFVLSDIIFGENEDKIILRPNGSSGLEMVRNPGTLSETAVNVAIGYTGSRGAIGFVGSAGTNGYTGSQGPAGTAVSIVGNLNNTNQLPGSGSNGQGYLIDGDLHTWTGNSWTNVGTIQGPIGYTGSAGTNGYTGSQGIQGLRGYTGSGGGGGGGAYGNFDGGYSDSNYGGITSIDAGGVTA